MNKKPKEIKVTVAVYDARGGPAKSAMGGDGNMMTPRIYNQPMRSTRKRKPLSILLGREVGPPFGRRMGSLRSI